MPIPTTPTPQLPSNPTRRQMNRVSSCYQYSGRPLYGRQIYGGTCIYMAENFLIISFFLSYILCQILWRTCLCMANVLGQMATIERSSTLYGKALYFMIFYFQLC